MAADFIFRVESVNLTAAQQKKIATAIQGAVLTELAQLDLGAQPPAPQCLFVPITWRGGLLIPPGEVQAATGTTYTLNTKT
jgi:hypothetical protein